MSERTGVLLCGDLGSERCGVGASEAAALAGVSPRPRTVDPRHVVAAVRAAARARRAGRPVVVAYPTRSTVRSVRATATLALVAVVARRRLRWHLHEYAIFGERRALLDLLLHVGGGRVVVSTASEAEALRRARRGRVARRVEVVVVPPANGSAPTGPTRPPAPAAEPPVVGLFGTARPDKGLDVAVAALRALPPGPVEVETVGEGWDRAAWPDGVVAGRDIRHRGRVPAADLGPLLARWTLAVAPFAEGATDGRMSLRTPLACGVPTLTSVGRGEDLTLRPPHLLLDPQTAATRALASGPGDRARGAAAVARFEADAVRRLADALWGP